MLTSNIVMSALSTLETANGNCTKGVIFTSVRNPREYQLLEQEYGRRSPVLSLGYIPRELERPRFTLQDLYNPSTATRVLQLKSTGMQLASAVNQIEWQILDALGRLNQDWSSPQIIKTPSKQLRVAVVGNKTLSLEGRNGTELFRALGCEPLDYDPWRDPFPMDAEAIYFPHSMGCWYGDRLMKHEPFCRGIMQSIAANRIVFVNGGSAPLFGRYFVSPDGEKHEALGIFPFHGVYSSPKNEEDLHRVEIRCTADTFITRNEEKLRGHALDYVHISNPGNLVPPVMAYRDVRKNTELGNSGWVKGYCFITDLAIDLWSNVDFVNRWLALRKR
jgi:cobyrinic acid a,c-diamide synthase